MNYLKIQKKILDALAKKNNRLAFWIKEDSVYLTFDGYSMFVIPKSELYLSLDKLTDIDLVSENFPPGMPEPMGEPGVITDSVRIMPNGTQAIKISSDSFDTFINFKFLKEFGELDGLSVMIPIKHVVSIYDAKTSTYLGLC